MSEKEFKRQDMMDFMRSFAEDEDPQVGIFWYDDEKNELFGVQSLASKNLKFEGNSDKTFPGLHKDFIWRVLNSSDTNDLYNYNWPTPMRGRIWEQIDGTFYVTVGDWIEGLENKVKPLILKEFNLKDFEFKVNYHYNLPSGGGDEIFYEI